MIDPNDHARVIDERNDAGAEAHRLRNAMKKAIESLTYDDDAGDAAKTLLVAALAAEEDIAARKGPKR